MELTAINPKLYEAIILTYMGTGSVKMTAQKCGTYPIKVRRVLITEGLWESKTSRQVGDLYSEGLPVPEIAKQLYISEKNVQSYLPYTRGQYGGDGRSGEAVRSLKYRSRNHAAGQAQVRKGSGIMGGNHNNEYKEELDMGMKKMNVMDERNRQTNGERPAPYAIKLHLELDMDKKRLSKRTLGILAQYGNMEEGISRDFIVPGDITLHALHYAINRAFGWQNSHLHSFRPYEKDYKRMVKKGMLAEWNRLAGMYFRFPTDDYEDIYWDDDYKADVSVKTWLRKKYTGPYFYGGTREYYYRCQQEVKGFLASQPTLEVRKPFNQWYWETEALAGKTGNKNAEADRIKRVAPITEVTVEELRDTIYFEGGFDELVERLPLIDILLMPGEEPDYDAWYFRNRSTLKQCEAEQMCLAPLTAPILKKLHYWYDYGDDWNVEIAAAEAYATKEEYLKSGYPAAPLEAYRPVCVKADGLPVCDDVGGIGGYCDMLKILHGEDTKGRESCQEWLRGMGWTGRKTKPENIL